MEPEPLTQTQMWEISDRLAWEGVDVEEQVQREHGLDGDDIEHIMRRFDYEWDSDGEVWASTRDIWRDEG